MGRRLSEDADKDRCGSGGGDKGKEVSWGCRVSWGNRGMKARNQRWEKKQEAKGLRWEYWRERKVGTEVG